MGGIGEGTGRIKGGKRGRVKGGMWEIWERERKG